MRLPVALPKLGRLIAALGCTVACSGESSTSLDAHTEAIRGGEPAPAANHIVAVVNFAGGQCTGAPIAPDLVLTARHCIGATEEAGPEVVCDETTFVDPDSAGAMFVLDTPEVTDDPDDYRPVRELRVLPGTDRALCGNDLVLLRLTEPLLAAPLVARIDLAPVAGEPYSAYGYGDDGGVEGGGVRRRLDGLALSCVGLNCSDPDVRATEWLGSDGICRGDSGGPALDAEGRILGVASRGLSGCRSPIYTSVFDFAEWLRTEAMLAAKAGGYEAPSWARTECDPTRENCEEKPTELASTCAYSRKGAKTTLLYWLMLSLGVCWRRVRRPGIAGEQQRSGPL